MFSITGKKIASVSLILMVAAIGTIGILKVSETKAATSSLSGACGMVSNLQHTFTIFGLSMSPRTVDAMAVIDFDSKKIWMNLTRATVDANYSTTSPSNVTYTSQSLDPIDFTIVTGPVPGSYNLTFASENISPPIILLPVNSGNTILVQGKNFKMTGVCQKI